MTESRSYPESSNATTVLVLGVVGLFFNIVAPVAWWLGNEEIRAIGAGKRAPENRSVANAGRVLGIIGTVLLVIGLLILLAIVIIGLAVAFSN
jgi:hypothetical protein